MGNKTDQSFFAVESNLPGLLSIRFDIDNTV